MAKTTHEIRDPVHIFIKLDSQERRVLDSPTFQRLRCIHQLAMTYLVYPGATHRRFEHSLGVMELASRVYDIITNPDNLTDEIRDLFPQTKDELQRLHWKRILRMAALCHDIGHLPFSHAAEELLPDGWDHEKMTRELILSQDMRKIWESMDPAPDPRVIVKLALGPKKAKDLPWNDWEALLAEIIVGDAFGVDRMDYLLRDSLHTGVSYGKFDHFRLIDTMRILPPPAHGDENEQSKEPYIGVESGGLESAESLLLARYFMFSQVYFHPIRRIYDIHLKDFLTEFLDGGCYPTDIDRFFDYTDSEIITALRKAAKNGQSAGHIHAERIINRNHFRVLYRGTLNDIFESGGVTIAKPIAEEASKKFGEDKIRFDSYLPKDSTIDFPILKRDNTIVSAHSRSQVLKQIPVVMADSVYVDKDIISAASKWYKTKKADLIAACKEEE